MTKRSICVLTFLAAVVVLTQVAAGADLEGRYRIYLMNGKSVEGDVTELPGGSYEVKTKYGVVVTVRKTEVKGVVSLEEIERTAEPEVGEVSSGLRARMRRSIGDEEIEEILSGIVAERDETLGAGREDMASPLPFDEDSVLEMLRIAGIERENVPWEEQPNVLIKDHFVMVHTASKESSRALGSRLERVYAWNVKFMNMLNLPAQRPEHKLELYYFGTHKEFTTHAVNNGGSPDAAGYYTPLTNRSQFFDLKTMPSLQGLLDRLKEPDINWRARQRITNRIRRLVEHANVEVIQHETGHQIHFNIGLFPNDALEREGGIPRWLVEGTTMMFEVPPSRAGGSLGVLNHDRVLHLRARFGWVPLSPEMWKLFIIDDSYWFGAGSWSMPDSYHLGWALVYYLWTEHRQGYGEYLRRVFGREEAMTPTEREAEFVECFGEFDDKWFDDFYEFIDRLELRPSLVNPRFEEAARRQNIARHRDFGGRGGHSGHRARDRERD